MTDDMLAIQTSVAIRAASSKSEVQPWMVKEWAVQRDYTWRFTRLVVKPVSAIRSGFRAICEALRGLKR